MAQYSEQLARPYLIENRIVEQLVQESYERLKEEVSASHILVALPQDADPADTLQAYRKADSLRQIALEGASFSMLAEQHSDDPSAARNGGKLGYFTSMQMVYPFETAAYHTPEGQVSDPVRTRFGYHIIKVNDRRPARGSVKVAHLMIRHDDPQKSGKDSEAYRQAMQIYQDLQQGAAWNEMVEKFSDDASTRASGGELPYFDTGGMPEEFEETAFSLNKQGEISEPVATRYGWHLIRLLDRKGLEPLEMLRPLLERKARSIAAQEELTDEMVQLLKEENAYQRNDRHYGELISYLSSRSPEISEPAPGAELFSLNDSSFAYAAFRDFTATQETELPMKKPEAEKLFGQFVAETIFDYEKEHLDEKNDEYRRLLQEYREGILLFNIMEERVWSRASRDTLGLRRFFEQHRDDYRWKERALATIVAAPNQKLLQLALVEARQADAPLSDEKIEEIESKFGQESAAELTIHRDA
jgi:peptidyl-prolyl cis-trans isomerase SurA